MTDINTTTYVGGTATHPRKGAVDVWVGFECGLYDSDINHIECEMISAIYDEGAGVDQPVPDGCISDSQMEALVYEARLEAEIFFRESMR